MGRMVQGTWITQDGPGGDVARTGDWKRTPSVVRGWIDAPGGRTTTDRGRYHLYAAWNCPWAHRVLLLRALMGIESSLPVSFVAPRRTDQGWVFDDAEGYPDSLGGARALHEVYAQFDSSYTGRATVPLLVDSQMQRLVSHESADILRMLPQGFQDQASNRHDFYPKSLRPDIDRWNDRIHEGLNNGVYRAGFAESQSAYEAAVANVFDTLDALETQLAHTDFVVGNHLTEADIRLFPTLARFDVGYYIAFKCCRKRLTDYPALWRYARRLYTLPGVAQTVKFDIYRAGYFSPSPKRNPLGIVPVAPEISWDM